MMGGVPVAAEAAAGARPPWIDPPAGLFVPGVLQLGRQPVLHVLRLDDADSAQLAGRHHLTRLPHEGVARVVVREAKDETAAPYGLYDVERILHGLGHLLCTCHIAAPAA